MTNSCGGCGGCCQGGSQQKAECPVCSGEAKKVPLDVVFNFANREQRHELVNTDYYICLNPECETAYFTIFGDTISVEDIRRPIWFKKGADPKIICYCNNITEDQIKEAVREHDLKSWAEIVLHYRKKKVCACDRLNPLGECCNETFYQIINETLAELGREPVKAADQCCG